MKVGDNIDTSKLGCRRFNVNVTLTHLRLNVRKFICWGATAFKADSFDRYKESKWFRFYVTGMNFKGHIYIELNGMDLYNVYYCTTRGTIKDISSDIYNDMICDVIDTKIEKIASYQH